VYEVGGLHDVTHQTLDAWHVIRGVLPRKREAAEELRYQATETSRQKVSQLCEIFNVRWSVFLLSPI